MKKFAILFIYIIIVLSVNTFSQVQQPQEDCQPFVLVLNQDPNGDPPHTVLAGGTYTIAFTGCCFDNTFFEFDAFGLNGMTLSSPGGTSTFLTWQAPNIAGQYNLVIRVIGTKDNRECIVDLPITITVYLPVPDLKD